MASVATARKTRAGGAKAVKVSDLAARRAEGTLIDVIQIALRDQILAGVYKPGQKLPITTFARDHDVSLGVMREALTRLAVDGIVTSEAMQGFSVVQTTVEDLDEVAQLLKQLMGTAIRQSVAHGGAEWEASLLAAHHLFKRAVRGESADRPRSAEVDRTHFLFWDALVSACGSRRMIGLLTSLQRSMMLYHRIAIGLLKDRVVEQVARYDEVTQRALEGDADGAAQLMLEDITIATELCRSFLDGDRNAAPIPARQRQRAGGQA